MISFRELDAYKVSQELTLAVHRAVERFRDRDAELAAELWQCALIATSRIARGTAFEHNRKLFAFCLNRSLSALTEVGYYLSLADGLNLLEKEVCRELEGRLGRANFYVTKLLFKVLEPPASG